MHTLWYNDPTNDWNKALPLGNGFMGAMCFAGTIIDRFQLNNDSVWWGGPRNRINPDAGAHIPLIQQLIRNGDICQAEELANETMAAIPDSQSHYEPLGDVFIIPEGDERIYVLGLRDYWNEYLTRTEHLPDYRRELDIETGIHRVCYTKQGISYRRESFISYPDRVMAVKCTGTPLRIIAERGNFCDNVYKLDQKTLCIEGQTGGNGVKFCLLIRVLCGNPSIKGRTLHCDGNAEIIMTSQTSFYKENYLEDALEILNQAEQWGYAQLRARHIADVSKWMNRCVLSLDCEDRSHIPTDQRLARLQAGEEDLGIINLAFAYGRYLLLSSSRTGSLPANLQGIWNKHFTPVWDSKYAININTQMNYWPAEITGLSELHIPLFEHIKRMAKQGAHVAAHMYGARGWMAHHMTDLWGDCAPQDTWPASPYWQMGGAWLCLHILEHYRYTEDKVFLEEFLPIVKEAALFFEDTLIENEKGELVVSPTVSPENPYMLPNGQKGTLCEGASMDAQILYELFHGLIETGMLTREEQVRYQYILDRLPTPQIEENGTIQEWAEAYEEVEIGHRHISHLFALYPGRQFFDAPNRNELLVAARKTLERRLAHGGGHTGWSRAWIINLWARLGDGERCYENILALLTQSMLPNLFDNHPPFQIDGNFGLVSGIAEMLLQSHTDETKLLPALPKAWKKGSITGLRSRNGQVYNIRWEDGRILSEE